MGLHIRAGYQNGRFIQQCSEPNTRLCVSATHVDGHVLGLSAQAHSLNYRSAVLHGYVDERVEKKDVKTKRELARLVTNHIGACMATLYRLRSAS